MKIIINGLNKYGEEFEWGETVKNHTQVSKTHTHTAYLSHTSVDHSDPLIAIYPKFNYDNV